METRIRLHHIGEVCTASPAHNFFIKCIFACLHGFFFRTLRKLQIYLVFFLLNRSFRPELHHYCNLALSTENMDIAYFRVREKEKPTAMSVEKMLLGSQCTDKHPDY